MKISYKVGGLRDFCIERNLYTRGDCKSYEKMLSKQGTLDLDEILWIAYDILKHSNTDYDLEELMSAIITCCAYVKVENIDANDILRIL